MPERHRIALRRYSNFHLEEAKGHKGLFLGGGGAFWLRQIRKFSTMLTDETYASNILLLPV